MSSELAKTRDKQPQFNHEQVELIKRTIAKGASDDELQLFLGICQRTGLDPFARQIYAISRRDFRSNQDVMTVQISIDGFRLIAARSGLYEGSEGPFWCAGDGVWKDVWLKREPPAASKVGVYRAGCRVPFWGVARFDEYVQSGRDGAPRGLWQKMPAAMLAKTAESLALRRAFPQELSGLYTADEMEQASNGHDTPTVGVSPSEPEPSRYAAMLEEFERLKTRLGAAREDIYYNVLKQYGVAHANEFPDLQAAGECYKQLLAAVKESERDYAAELNPPAEVKA